MQYDTIYLTREVSMSVWQHLDWGRVGEEHHIPMKGGNNNSS